MRLHRKRSFCLCNLKKTWHILFSRKKPRTMPCCLVCPPAFVSRSYTFLRVFFVFFTTSLYPAPPILHHSTQPTRDGHPVHLVVVGSRKASLTLTSERCHSQSEKAKCVMYPEFTASCPHLNPRLLSPRCKKKKKSTPPQLHTLPLSRC